MIVSESYSGVILSASFGTPSWKNQTSRPLRYTLWRNPPCSNCLIFATGKLLPIVSFQSSAVQNEGGWETFFPFVARKSEGGSDTTRISECD